MLPKIRAYVNLDAINHNFSVIKKAVGDARIIASVKADAYGQGAAAVAGSLAGAGCDYFGVSSFDEAMALRDAGIGQDILILGYTPPELGRELAEAGITQTVYDAGSAAVLAEHAKRSGKELKIHIKLDTGMGRVGLNCRDGNAPLEDIRRICSLDGLSAEGIFTHFTEADDPSSGFTKLQFDRFMRILSELEAGGLTFKLRHAANSGGILNFPEMMLDAVRPGIILYGLRPNPKIETNLDLIPSMSLETIVVRSDRMKAGEGLSYSRTHVLPEDTDITTLAVGYADGYPRALSNRGEVYLNGKRAKIRGNVCMDMLMVEAKADVGDKATLFGPKNGCDISLDELAEQLATINYELACHVGKRVMRIYCNDGRGSL